MSKHCPNMARGSRGLGPVEEGLFLKIISSRKKHGLPLIETNRASASGQILNGTKHPDFVSKAFEDLGTLT